jgi:hypothetical protein
MLSRIFDSGDAGEPRRRDDAGEHEPAAGHLEPTLDADDPADVLEVALAEVVESALANGVELLPEDLELLGRERGHGVGHGCIS